METSSIPKFSYKLFQEKGSLLPANFAMCIGCPELLDCLIAVRESNKHAEGDRVEEGKNLELLVVLAC